MQTLRSYVGGKWHQAAENFSYLVNPCTEEQIAQASSHGIDFKAAVEHARKNGIPALHKLTFPQRAALLEAAYKALYAKREELIYLSMLNTGVTRSAAKLDVDGATTVLEDYSRLGKGLGDRKTRLDRDGVQLGSPYMYGQHVYVPRNGIGIHINPYNFPVWSLAQKLACALLAGAPVITKPATSTAMVSEKAAEILVEAKIFPDGVFSFVCGSVEGLLKHLDYRDVIAFTGSMKTADILRSYFRRYAESPHFNIEADSLNAAVLGPDVGTGSETLHLMRRHIKLEIEQKSGQKCTAPRRIIVPDSIIEYLQEQLCDDMNSIVVGNPLNQEVAEQVTMGPLATEKQLKDAISGVKSLKSVARLIYGKGERVDGRGAEGGRGHFFSPTLLMANDPYAEALHKEEVFAPVATIIPYNGSPEEAAKLVNMAGGSLVTTLYGDDPEWLKPVVFGNEHTSGIGHSTGRIYLGSRQIAGKNVPSHGMVLPQLRHGGPGRAGGGQELGGERGLEPYFNDLAIQGSKRLIEELVDYS